jgi:hypothetical protein
MKIIIWGTGSCARFLYPKIEAIYGGDIIFADNNPALKGDMLFDKHIISPDEIIHKEYDKIIIATLAGYDSVKRQLTDELCVCDEKIDLSHVHDLFEKTLAVRNRFLSRFAEIVYTCNLHGNIAEGGVFEGYFAKMLNLAFPDRMLYLFDTFEGFDARDTLDERGDAINRVGHNKPNILEQDFISNLPFPEKVILHKGYFPDTTKNINDSFVFVNLDFDLYKPTLAGLEYFWPRMTSGGVILVHDYFNALSIGQDIIAHEGVFRAVNEFADKYKTPFVPIGDEMSVVFIKTIL